MQSDDTPKPKLVRGLFTGTVLGWMMASLIVGGVMQDRVWSYQNLAVKGHAAHWDPTHTFCWNTQ